MEIISTRYGKMNIIQADSVVSHSLKIYGEWAENELDFLRKIITPGMNVLDVGAFIGTHTLAFSAFVGQQGKVYSFEPRKEIYAVLLENISLNNLKNVIPSNIGLAEKEGILYLESLDISQNTNFGSLAIDSDMSSSTNYTYPVNIFTIDHLNIEKIDLIKLDVEGMESRVLDGSIAIILRDQPIIFCECNSAIAGGEILEFCKSVEYEAYGLLASAYNEKNFNAIDDNFFGPAKELTLVLMPSKNSPTILSNLKDVNLLTLNNLEDLILPLLFKPQYPYEVLANTATGFSLGIDFPSPALTKRDQQITSLDKTLLARDAEVINLKHELSHRDAEVINLKHELSHRDDEVKELISSTSWFITKPFRWFTRLMRGNFVAAADPFKRILSLNSSTSNSQNCHLAYKKVFNSICNRSNAIQPSHSASVVLPVYRGVEMTKRCILSAMPNILTTSGARLLAINDASPDVGMQEMLLQIAEQWPDKFFVLENDSNLGFVRTVNKGLAYFSQEDVILLNSDVIVPKDWLSRLAEEAYSQPDVGTVTPFSNNATICSFPYFCQENNPPFDLEVDVIDSVFINEKLPCLPAPTGVGFCMYIRRTCLDKVGYLDEENFGRGYGEENDLCQRILKTGWLNLISPNMYVFHQGGASFSSEKQKLVDDALRVLSQLHPSYHIQVQSYIQSDPIKHARVTRYVQLLGAITLPKVLHISHSLGGGVKQHIEELEEYYGPQVANLLLIPSQNGMKISIRLGASPNADSLTFSVSTQYVDMLELLKTIDISAVHYHHTIGLDRRLLNLSTDLGALRLITVHDYYWLFGNPTLTDEAGKYPGYYSEQLNNPLHSIPKGITIKAWQEQHRSFIEEAECVIFPSNSTKVIFENVYHPAKSVIAPHIEPYLKVNALPANFEQKNHYTIGVLGALGKEKGADLLEQLALEAKEGGLNFTFKLIGYAYKPLKTIKNTGPYEAKELKYLIKEHKLDILLFTAQWPETYSYTLSNALDSGLPIFAPNIGAFPERLSGRANVFLFDYLMPTLEVLDKLNTFVGNMSTSTTVKAPVSEYHRFNNNNFYSQEYYSIVSRGSKHIEINKLKTFNIAPSWIATAGLANKNASWRNTVMHYFWQLRMNRYSRGLTNTIPPGIRRAIRQSLGGGNSHEIALGSKGKNENTANFK